jgi:HAE1 family hydrophobic/amphiphilic exporter-1
MTPEVEDTVIAVTTRWENAAPQDIESEVVEPQEEKLQGVAGLKSLTSVSQRSQGQIRLEFETGVDKDAALREVSNKLREVPDYPENVDEPVIADSDPDSQDYIAWVCLACSDPDFDISLLYDFMDSRVKPRFERIPGVSEVGLLGGREREVQIRVDARKLAQRGIPIASLVNQLRLENRDTSGGAVPDGKNDVRLRGIGRFSNPAEVEATVIADSPAGVVRLGDVAEVVETAKEKTDFVRSRGIPVMAFNFKREIGSNVISVMDSIRAEIARLNAPDGLLAAAVRQHGIKGRLELQQVYDQTVYIDQALLLVRDNILLGAVLAIVALLFFLRSPRAVGIIGIAIPISAIGTIVILVMLGRTINIISLAGIAFAIGMVVDNSIVVLENIFRHLEMGKKRVKACLDGSLEVASAVLASTLTTVVVFLPILLIQEAAGQLFRDIALAIMAAVSLSYIVSITVIPAAGALLLSTPKRPEGQSPQAAAEASQGWLAAKLGVLVYKLCAGTGLRLGVTAAFGIVTVLGTALLIPPLDYLPSGNRNIVFGLLITPPGYNMKQLDEIGHRIEERMRPAWQAVAPTFQEAEEAYAAQRGDDSLGRGERSQVPEVPIAPMPGAPMIRPPGLQQYFVVAAGGRMFHGALSEDPQKVVDLLPLFQYATQPDVIPGVMAFAFQLPLFRTGGSSGQAVKIDVSGPDLEQVTQASLILLGTLAQSYGPYSTQPEPMNFNLPSPELQVYPDKLRLAELGLSSADLALAVQAAGDGAIIGEYRAGSELVDLKVLFSESIDRDSLESLRDVPIASPSGQVVTLADVSRLVRSNEADQIKRVGRQRAVSLQLTPPPGIPLDAVIDELRATVQGLKQGGVIAQDLQVEFAGSAFNWVQLNLMKRRGLRPLFLRN